MHALGQPPVPVPEIPPPPRPRTGTPPSQTVVRLIYLARASVRITKKWARTARRSQKSKACRRRPPRTTTAVGWEGCDRHHPSDTARAETEVAHRLFVPLKAGIFLAHFFG